MNRIVRLRGEAPQTPEQVIEGLVERGEDGAVANMLVHEMKDLPDKRKKELIITAAQNRRQQLWDETTVALDQDVDFWNDLFRRQGDKIKTLQRSKKGGKALNEQLKAMYPATRD
jgi:spore germination protein YaaH